MTWLDQWSIKVDGHELNSFPGGGAFSTTCPEVDWMFEQIIKMRPVDGDYPAYIGLQPQEGNYTLLIQMTACIDSVYDSRVAQLKAWMPAGQHVLTFQVRGMAAPKTVTVIVRNMVTNFKMRQVTVMTTAPTPVLA